MGIARELLRILESLWFQLQQIGLYWLAGIAAGSLISVYLSERIVGRLSLFRAQRFMPLALVLSAVLGIFSPLCMFGTVPLIAALGRKGVPDYLLAAFCVSSILLNPSLMVMSFALGGGLALLRVGISVCAGLLAGILVFAFFRFRPFFHFEVFEPKTKQRRGLIEDFFHALRVTAPYLFAGILLTALYDLYVPRQWMSAIFAGNEAFATLFAMSLAIPLYACGGGSIPLLIAWLREGMSIGNAALFMIAGPATKLTNLGALKMVLGKRHFVYYLVYILLFAVVVGALIDGVMR